MQRSDPVVLGRVLPVLLVAFTFGCKKKYDEPPQPMPVATKPAEPALGTAGASCIFVACDAPLVCSPTKKCARLDGPEMLAVAEVERAAEKAMLAKSGVETPTTAEEPPPAPPADPAQPPPVGAVRVVTTSNEGKGSRAVAACTADERLVGGGCDPPRESYATHHTATDTIGARWNCGRTGEAEMWLTAHAFCQRVTSR